MRLDTLDPGHMNSQTLVAFWGLYMQGYIHPIRGLELGILSFGDCLFLQHMKPT